MVLVSPCTSRKLSVSGARRWKLMGALAERESGGVSPRGRRSWKLSLNLARRSPLSGSRALPEPCTVCQQLCPPVLACARALSRSLSSSSPRVPRRNSRPAQTAARAVRSRGLSRLLVSSYLLRSLACGASRERHLPLLVARRTRRLGSSPLRHARIRLTLGCSTRRVSRLLVRLQRVQAARLPRAPRPHFDSAPALTAVHAPQCASTSPPGGLRPQDVPQFVSASKPRAILSLWEGLLTWPLVQLSLQTMPSR